jgi:CRP/FNR family transcriptional regulator, nitrogen oxide reductase regulator
MDGDLANKIKVFKNCPSFVNMDEKAIKEIAALATECRFKKGDLVFREGDQCDFFYVVKQGRVKCFKESRTGKHFITNVSTVSDSLGVTAMFEGEPRFLSARVVEDTTLLRVKREDYMSWVRRHPSVMLTMLTLSARVVGSIYDRFIDMVGETAEQRICNVLYMLYGKFGGSLNFTCEEIADLVGTTTETAIRILAKLKGSGVLAPTRGKILILDQTELKKLSRGADHVPGKI